MACTATLCATFVCEPGVCVPGAGQSVEGETVLDTVTDPAPGDQPNELDLTFDCATGIVTITLASGAAFDPDAEVHLFDQTDTDLPIEVLAVTPSEIRLSFAFQTAGPGRYSAKVRNPSKKKKPTVSLSRSPATITLGQSTILTWTSRFGTTAAGSGDWSGTKALSGSEILVPTTTGLMTYTLTVTGPGGTTSSTVTVTVNPVPTPPTLIFDGLPPTVTLGDTVTLTWSSTGGATATASGGWSGGKALSGMEVVEPLAVGITTYTLTLVGPGGSVAQSVGIVVQAAPAPPTLTFTGSAPTLTLGQSLTLMWNSTNGATATASDAWSGAKALSGSADVTPVSVGVTTYTLTIDGAGGSVTESVAVTVGAPPSPPVLVFSGAPTTITIGESTLLTWSSANAASVTASGAWSGGKALSGSQSVTPVSTGTVTYTLSATGNGGTVTQSVAIVVLPAPAPPTVSLSSAASSLILGQSTLLTWSSTNGVTATASGAWTGSKALSGSESVEPTAIGVSTYTLTIDGAGGSVAMSVTITVTAPPPVLTFSGFPTSLVLGDSTVLTWSSSDATAATASGAWTGPKAIAGSQSVTPSVTGAVVYTLTAIGPGGTDVESVTITVSAPPPPGGKTVLQFSDFTYLGMFKVPLNAGGISTRYNLGMAFRRVSGQKRLLMNSPNIYEMTVPVEKLAGPFNTASYLRTWGPLSDGAWRTGNVRGMYWDEIDQRLYQVMGEAYNPAPTDHRVVYYATLDETTGGHTTYGPWALTNLTYKMTMGGVTGIPAAFADANLGGKRIALGFGGAYSTMGQYGPGSAGPALTAIAPPSPTTPPFSALVDKPLLAHWWNTVTNTQPLRWARSDDLDVRPSFKPSTMWYNGGAWPASGGIGYWTWDDNFEAAGVWIDTPTKHGMLFAPALATGYNWYELSSTRKTGLKHYWSMYDPAFLLLAGTTHNSYANVVEAWHEDITYPFDSYPKCTWLPGDPTDIQHVLGGAPNYQTPKGMAYDPLESKLYILVAHPGYQAPPAHGLPVPGFYDDQVVYVYQVS